MKEEKVKKNEYEKALSAYGDAMKEFHKGKVEKTQELLKAFLEKYSLERELVDRAQIYLKICQERGKQNSFPLKTFDDHLNSSVYKINKRDYEGAVKLLGKALEMKVDEGKVYYLMAVAFCFMKENETSLDYLKKAIQKDKFYRVLAQNEVDFQPLWEDKKFKLITRMT